MRSKIVILSADPERVRTISNVLAASGHQVFQARSGDEAMEMCKREHVDLVFVDSVQMAPNLLRIVPDLRRVIPDLETVAVVSPNYPEGIARAEAHDLTMFLFLPLSPEKIASTTARVLRHVELLRDNRRLLVAVTAAKKEWEATVDAIEQPIFVTDFDHTILRANLATFQALGKGVGEVLGRKCHEVFHCSTSPLETCPGTRARDSGEPAIETLYFKGIRRRLTCSVYPQVFANGGGLVHYLHEPVASTEQQAEILAKYERLFDDAGVAMLLVGRDDYKIADANQRAITLLGGDPERFINTDFEDLFPEDRRETVVHALVHGDQGGEPVFHRTRIGPTGGEADVWLMAHPLVIGVVEYLQVTLLRADQLPT